MRDYDIKRGHWKNIEGDQLLHLMQDIFGEVDEVDGALVVKNWGAFERLSVQYLDKTTLRVDSEMDRGASMEDAQRTIRTWNDFLELVTGMDTKERKKRTEKATKAAEEP